MRALGVRGVRFNLGSPVGSAAEEASGAGADRASAASARLARAVRGSDWPPTWFEGQELPGYESLWLPVVRALGQALAERVRSSGACLYS